MSERNEHPPGVPCWVDTWQPDATAAASFYAGLFGWDTQRTTGEGSDVDYVMCRLRGRDVAGIGSGREAPPGWTTYVRVESADDAAARAVDHGGSLVVPPFPSVDGGRIAVLADPVGAAFAVRELGTHRGANLVNEPGAWAMSVLLTDEPATATPFYEAVCGWRGEPFQLGDAEATLLRLDGYVGGEPTQPVPRDVVAAMAPAFGRPSGWVVNFWVDDADSTAARAPELGGTVVAGPFDTSISRDAVIADPAGAVFSVSTAPAAPPPR